MRVLCLAIGALGPAGSVCPYAAISSVDRCLKTTSPEPGISQNKVSSLKTRLHLSKDGLRLSISSLNFGLLLSKGGVASLKWGFASLNSRGRGATGCNSPGRPHPGLQRLPPSCILFIF